MSKISDELQAARNMLFPIGSIGYGTISELADRIRRLAEREASNGTD